MLAGLTAYYYMQYSTVNTNYETLNSQYSNQQSYVVLSDALSHWNYISIENLSLLAKQYTTNATLDWVGGALSGTYNGISSIESVWNKFFGLWSAVWFYAINPSVTVNENTANVSALVQFVVTPAKENYQVQYLNIDYKLDYINTGGQWLIDHEVWAVKGAGFSSENQNDALINAALNNAYSHWNAISIENISLVMQQYANNSVLYWIGGALNGTYTGYTSIEGVWNKFFSIWSAVWFYSAYTPLVTINGNAVTVNSTIQFVVQRATNQSQFFYINVGYTIVYKVTFNAHTGQYQLSIMSETFKVDKTGPLSQVAAP
ncbi:MAG TPA: nuclear transport factor 2 family protein [Geobacterales bacterium]|nr:nuclear transport factor 2 family protein [Geobacterales bacterium]